MEGELVLCINDGVLIDVESILEKPKKATNEKATKN